MARRQLSTVGSLLQTSRDVKNKMRLAIIPARSGSKRIPDKNIIDFFGNPMIHYALDAAARSCLFDEIHVSTDSTDIADICARLGHRPKFFRPAELSTDYIGLADVVKWTVAKYESYGKYYDEICCIMPSAPLLRAEDIKNAYLNHWLDKNYPLLCVAKFPVPTGWSFRKSLRYICPTNPADLNKRSQDIETEYYECGPFNWWTRTHFASDHVSLAQVNFFLVPAIRAVDIDEPEDLELAKALFLYDRQKSIN